MVKVTDAKQKYYCNRPNFKIEYCCNQYMYILCFNRNLQNYTLYVIEKKA